MAKKFAIIKKTPDPVTATRVKTTKTYTAEDARTGDKSYGRESLTKPTPGFVKQAQSEGKDIVKKDGKNFRAGRTDYSHDYKLNVPVSKPDVKALKVTPTPTKSFSVIKKDKVAPAQKFGKIPTRKMERVDYLRNKDAKGISSERRRPKKQSGF